QRRGARLRSGVRMAPTNGTATTDATTPPASKLRWAKNERRWLPARDSAPSEGASVFKGALRRSDIAAPRDLSSSRDLRRAPPAATNFLTLEREADGSWTVLSFLTYHGARQALLPAPCRYEPTRCACLRPLDDDIPRCCQSACKKTLVR